MQEKMKKIVRKISHTQFSVVFYVIYEVAIFFMHALVKMGWLFTRKAKPNDKDIQLMKENVTFLYKTFERQRMAKKLFQNIQKYYPGVKVIIADDSEKPVDIVDEKLEIIRLPFNSGLSFGLNRALERVKTPFIIRMDDDELLTPDTRFHEQLKFLMEHSEVDLVGVLPFNLPRWTNLRKEAQKYYAQSMSRAPKRLKIPHMTQMDERRKVVAKPPNIFIARTDKIREVGYDDNIRMIDHNEFFYRAAGNIVSVLDETAYVLHYHNQFNRSYQKYREDVTGDIAYIRKKMNKVKLSERFLEALGASLKKESVSWSDVSEKEWQNLFRLAKQQQVLPLIFEAVFDCAAAKKYPEMMDSLRKKVFEQTAMQAVKTNEFLELYQKLCNKKVIPLVVKGLVCREHYLLSNHRLSVDEDLLIRREDYETVHQTMLDEGMSVQDSKEDIYEAYEVPYIKEGSYIYVEIHKQLFPNGAEAYREYNRFFDKVHERFIVEHVNGVPIYTMCHTDHLLYLICHAFKHFLHSGIGIRQVCDIVLFANAHGKEIDWEYLYERCKEMRAEKIVATMFRLGRKYFGFDDEKACYSKHFQMAEMCEDTLLKDMLEGGILGNVNTTRMHSSNITLNAVIADKKGKSGKGALLKTVFPPVSKMKGRYRYLNKYPYLLPIAWMSRVFKYGKEVKENETNNPSVSIKLGEHRVEMLKEYDVIDKK